MVMAQKFENILDCYEAIGRWLVEEAPEPWDVITVHFRIIEIDDVCEPLIVYRSTKRSGVEKQFFIGDTNFGDCFYQLAKLTSSPEKGFYKVCHFVLHKEGHYDVDFEY